MKRIFTLLCGVAAFSYAHSQVVISQIYGAGGNTGATYRNDYVELFNPTNTPASLSTYTIQYGSAANPPSSGNTASLSGTVPARSYFLIALAGGSNGAVLPVTADLSIPAINLSATVGKVSIVNSSTANATCPTTSTQTPFVDYVGFGSTASCSLGTPAPAPSTTTAIFRKLGGYTNDGNNSTDFEVSTPAPRNSAIILPLQFLSFSATPKENAVAFSWKTANERNTHHFEIEQSFDGSNFKSIATVAAAGNSTTEKSYSYTGTLNNAVTYYRLRSIDIDGKNTTSSVVKVAPSKTGFSLGNVYPIPAKNNVTVEWNSNKVGATSLVLTDMSGRTVRTLNLQSNQGLNQYQLDVNTLTSGQYFLRLKNDVNQVQTVITKQ